MYPNALLRVIASVCLATCLNAAALAGTECPQHFAAGKPPAITNPKLQPRTQEVCFEAFAVLHSGLSRTPLYAAEHLTRSNLEAARELSRENSFHAESALPASHRAELSDYARSGYDRGHMAPNADFGTRTAQGESFSLANMVPQVHANNAGIWAGIESAARKLAMDEGEIYVVSGPAFIGSDIKKIGNVLVPTHLWKVLYSPKQQRAGAYVITNDETREYSTFTVTDLEKMVGVSPLPGLPQEVRDSGMALPKPNGRQQQPKSQTKNPQDKASAESPAASPAQAPGGGQPEKASTLGDFLRSLIGAIKRAI